MRYYPPGWDLAYEKPGLLMPRVDELLRERLGPQATVLDFGAGGRPNWTRRSFCGKLVGVDVDPSVLKNPGLHESAMITPDGRIPYPDASFDAAIAHWVFEHLSDPDQPLAELGRVMKPNAPLIFITLNRRHWLCVLSRCIPRSLSRMLAERLGQGPAGAGRAFETYYRLNTEQDLRRHGQKAGLLLENLRYFETHPVYFRLFRPLYPLCVALERRLNRSDRLAHYRVNLVGVYRRG